MISLHTSRSLWLQHTSGAVNLHRFRFANNVLIPFDAIRFVGYGMEIYSIWISDSFCPTLAVMCRYARCYRSIFWIVNVIATANIWWCHVSVKWMRSYLDTFNMTPYRAKSLKSNRLPTAAHHFQIEIFSIKYVACNIYVACYMFAEAFIPNSEWKTVRHFNHRAPYSWAIETNVKTASYIIKSLPCVHFT